ncbi:hypothetical protein PHLGIDRAFT_119267 [Phlebiopsis gigantea 11061_1 CR5-6]|uniref:F-box domain-containing protein n=1 Tax=Phlebiopsis gigantea (strain 11061_1 CR5-6) TaxID=745531 RepID=A0A0C3S9C2_PHLG1|nr:hypothetical protein PHLGIDRAFT_119267 [Phlebiopsis gigantea 11061_1 CR5-6]
MPDLELAYAVDVSRSAEHSQNASELPEEIIYIILKHLCIDQHDLAWGESFFDRALGRCSLTCRYWAAHIRPVLFAKLVLRSQNDVAALGALVRSSVVVPGMLGAVVREIDLVMDEGAHPWMYHVWALVRDGVLPSLRSIDLRIDGAGSVRAWHTGRHRCAVMYDVGLPRTRPSDHTLHLRRLLLHSLKFDSSNILLRCLASVNADTVQCVGLQWPEDDTTLPTTVLPLPRTRSFTPHELWVDLCTAVSPFVRSFLTTRPPRPGTARRQAYVGPAHLDTAMALARLLSEECACSECTRTRKQRSYLLRMYHDPADAASACISVTYAIAHALTLQLAPEGTVTRVGLTVHGTAGLLAPPALAQLDRLCSALGDALREVVVALYPDDAPAPVDDVFGTLRAVRDAMPGAARSGRLVFRVLRPHVRATFEDAVYGDDRALRRVFERGAGDWADVAHDAC